MHTDGLVRIEKWAVTALDGVANAHKDATDEARAGSVLSWLCSVGPLSTLIAQRLVRTAGRKVARVHVARLVAQRTSDSANHGPAGSIGPWRLVCFIME